MRTFVANARSVLSVLSPVSSSSPNRRSLSLSIFSLSPKPLYLFVSNSLRVKLVKYCVSNICNKFIVFVFRYSSNMYIYFNKTASKSNSRWNKRKLRFKESSGQVNSKIGNNCKIKMLIQNILFGYKKTQYSNYG